MVKAKESHHILPDGSIILESWLQTVASKYQQAELSLIRRACELSQFISSNHSVNHDTLGLQQGLAMAEILLDLDLDQETIAAAIAYASIQHTDLAIEVIAEQLGSKIAKLVRSVEHMEGVRSLHNRTASSRSQVENLRKMLLAMVEDIRVVLIKLAEYTWLLRTANQADETEQKKIAREALDIYAPLANRLGIGQLKWELEDLAFRYIDPPMYKKLAKLLDAKRLDREKYIQNVVAELKLALTTHNIANAQVQGRAKHIYSIYRKMERKDIGYEKIYDISAVRVLVDSVEDCYAVLSIVHSLWQQIPQEFDDYIAVPKENGYRSIHTAVLGPAGKNVEVQIRTYTMHQESELGIAAHWRYKEGGGDTSGYEAKIACLRQVLAWHKELSGTEQVQLTKQNFDDRVYIFTPNGEIIDLPQGATPLDFAYYLHSEIGHRCRGAKVNGNIVPLTYTLATGEQVEILTSKQPNPSRDWLSPQLGYLKTSRARAKVHHWLKLRDMDKHVEEGQMLLEKELKRLDLINPDLDRLAEQLHYKTSKELLAALGCGDLRLPQLLNHIQPLNKVEAPIANLPLRQSSKIGHNDISIHGIGKLLTNMAKCCRPIPGDNIIGYITMGRGITIHRQDCKNIAALQMSKSQRLVAVNWGQEPSSSYPVDITITAFDRQGLMRDVTALFTHEKMNLIAMQSHIDHEQNTAHIHATLEIKKLTDLNRLIDRLQQLPNILQVERRN
jgi:GTP pyrophosphokinase